VTGTDCRKKVSGRAGEKLTLVKEEQYETRAQEHVYYAYVGGVEHP
jgi:hypothetical protein